MNKVNTVLAGVAAFGLASFGAANLMPEQNVTSMQDMVNSSVQIGKYCSGTVIQDPDLSDGEQVTVISAHHCLDSDQGVGTILEVNVPNIVGNEYVSDKTIKVIVTDVSEKSDLILMQVLDATEGRDLPKIDIYKGLPQFGDDVVSVGYPLGGVRTMTTGILGYIESLMYVYKTSCVFPSESCRYQKATPGIAPGSSGGGLFKWTDNGYELIGVLTGADMRVTFADFYTPVDEIREFLEGDSNEAV